MPGEGVPEEAGLTRRVALKRMAVVGTAVWTAPVIESLAAPVWAAGSFAKSQLCGKDCSGNNNTPGAIQTMTLRYMAELCGADNCQPTADAFCVPTPTVTSLPDTAYLILFDCQHPTTKVYYSSTVTKGVDFTVTGPLAGTTCYALYTDSTKTSLLETGQLTTSCNRPFQIGDEYGGFRIIGGTIK